VHGLPRVDDQRIASGIIFAALSAMDGKPDTLTIDATHPKAHALLGDKGYDADWFRHALLQRGTTPCIPRENQPKTSNPSRPHTLSLPAPRRKYVRKAQGLAAYPHALRSLRTYLHVCHLHRCNCQLLAIINES
jgi:hypothetical protein